MTRKELLESGLLEMYVLKSGTPAEMEVVEKALKEFPDLRQELYAIEASLKQYALLHGVEPSSGLKSEILKKIKSKSRRKDSANKNKNNDRRSFFGPFLLSLMASIGLLGFSWIQNSNMSQLESEFEKSKIECDSLQLIHSNQEAIFAEITNPSTKIFSAQATDKYPSTKILIYNNPETQTNYLQFNELPSLADNQSFQLWSLKDGVDPVPLDVFQGGNNEFLEVEFVEGTSAYAITIEPKGGQDTPTLENLIGIFPIS